MGQFPAKRPGTQLAGAGLRRAGRRAGALGVEVVALSESDQQPPASLGVGDRQPAQAGAGLPGVDQLLQRRALQVVGDRLAFEQPDGDGVRAGLQRRIGGGLDLHAGRKIPAASIPPPQASHPEAARPCHRP